MYRLGDCICFAGTVSKTTRKPFVISFDIAFLTIRFMQCKTPMGFDRPPGHLLLL
jgi:hypothetical protein